MTLEEIYEMLTETELPCAYHSFDNATGQAPPFVCYYFEDSDDLYADDSNYVKIRPLTIELYTDDYDPEKILALEAVLNNHGLTYKENQTYIESEQMYMIIFETEVIYHG